MRPKLSGTERALAAAALILLVVAMTGPAIAQAAGFHDFADQRTLWGVPLAMDVLSNVAFAAAGLAGLAAVRQLPTRSMSNMQHAMARLFFTGLLLTAAASAWYHAQPEDATLALDRYAMAVAFGGLLGLAVATQISERAAAVAGLAVLLLGALAVRRWTASGDLLPWVTLQGGGMAILGWLALLRPCRAAPRIGWSLVLLAYVAAKCCELADHQIFAWTGGFVAGHALKHVIAAAAAWPVIAALGALRPPRQNRAAGCSTMGDA